MPEPTASTTVRDLVQGNPEAFEVLVSHGMCADCKADPPAVTLERFARKHCNGDLSGLLAEIVQAIRAGMGGFGDGLEAR